MYVHKCCSDIKGKQVRKKLNTEYWHCSKCNNDIDLPFNPRLTKGGCYNPPYDFSPVALKR